MINDIKRPQQNISPNGANAKKTRQPKRTLVMFFICLVVTVLVLGSLVVWKFFPSTHNENLDDVATVAKRVERHYILPADEQPALITVTDKSKVKTEFLRAAENGDKLLVYKDAKKALLYRPSIDKLVEVGPVSLAE